MLQTIRIEEKLLGKNDELAARNRERLNQSGIYAISLCGSPGGGKTSLLEQIVPLLSPTVKLGVIEGDIETDLDGQRIAALGVPVTQLVTAGTCHLDAAMVARGMDRLPLGDIELLIIENVGNLVCPASYALGEHARVVVLSLTEGEDKPLKYPAMFRKADALVLNKIDLAPYLPPSAAEAADFAKLVRPGLPVFRTSCTTGEGIPAWIAWLNQRRTSWRQAA